METGKEAGRFKGHTSNIIQACNLEKKDGLFATCSWDRTVKLWDFRYCN
jgi:hypothetical protein